MERLLHTCTFDLMKNKIKDNLIRCTNDLREIENAGEDSLCE